MRVEKLYAVFDVEMQMWTSPVVFRNDTEAKRCFNAMKDRNDFNDCKVEFYCLGDYVIDHFPITNPIIKCDFVRRLYLDDTVDDDVTVDGDTE